MLNEEETTDNDLRAKFNQRWSRTPSGDLYKPLRAGTYTQGYYIRFTRHTCLIRLSFRSFAEGTNFRNVLDKAVQADQVVKERYNAHCEMIALLCKPESELSAAIPSANPAKTLQGSEVRRTLTQLSTMSYYEQTNVS